MHYQNIEKIALALVMASRNLWCYFLVHIIIIQTDVPVKQVLHRPDLAEYMIKWFIEISEFDISFEQSKALKLQVFIDFFTYGLSNRRGSRANLLLESEVGLTIEVSLHFEFTTTNNQVEYEVFIVGTMLAFDMGA